MDMGIEVLQQAMVKASVDDDAVYQDDYEFCWAWAAWAAFVSCH
jgi:hypothetical protein